MDRAKAFDLTKKIAVLALLGLVTITTAKLASTIQKGAEK
jgi:hypothetical protein